MAISVDDNLFTHRDFETIGMIKRSLRGSEHSPESETEQLLEEIISIFEKIKSRIVKVIDKKQTSRISINSDPSYHVLRLHEEITQNQGIIARLLKREPKSSSVDLSLTSAKFSYKRGSIYEKGTSLQNPRVVDGLRYFRDRLRKALIQIEGARISRH